MSENLRSDMSRRMPHVVVFLVLVAGCKQASPARADSVPGNFPITSAAQADPARDGAAAAKISSSTPRALTRVTRVVLDAPRKLVENSGAAMSASQPGVLFTINDSGNEPLLFALDTTGADRGVWRVEGSRNRDWEAISIGPCGAQGQPSAASCIYIGDVGDNGPGSSPRMIYRLREPKVDEGKASKKTGTVIPEVLRFTFPDRPHDVEGMYVARNGDVVMITKRPLADRRGRLRPALVFRIPASAWGGTARVVASLADSLVIVPGSIPFRMITDASLAPDAKHLAVRTYAEVYVFATDPATGAVNHTAAPTVCDVTTLGENQGEGLTWANASGRLIFTSEGRRSPLYLADCALP